MYLDTNIIILAIETEVSWSGQLHTLFDEFDRGSIRAVTSELTIAEALAKPIALDGAVLIERYRELFEASSVEMLPIDRSVLNFAAQIQGRSRLKLADAIHVASARLAKCDHFLTQDERLGRAIAGEPNWLQLSESI
ncbi:MAG: PIN domain-containing protein [Tardiphaga sp.]|uniref:type II toxin-antitoxin system VapC family toxin n=1 Tax=Tardiphaga sp. TaxID=1926292 RepID=UPI00199A1616|nr:PIN domain-containing protein [Tardiphaga sp.]